MYQITKSYGFAYAHRVWAQALDEKLSVGSKPKCRHVHGHEANVIVTLESGLLQSHDVVLDYNEFKFFKKILDETFDHKNILDTNDPLLMTMGIDRNLFSLSDKWPIMEYNTKHGANEYLEGVILISGIPTSENLCVLLAKIFLKEFPGHNSAKLKSIEFKESDSSSAKYVL